MIQPPYVDGWESRVWWRRESSTDRTADAPCSVAAILFSMIFFFFPFSWSNGLFQSTGHSCNGFSLLFLFLNKTREEKDPCSPCTTVTRGGLVVRSDLQDYEILKLKERARFVCEWLQILLVGLVSDWLTDWRSRRRVSSFVGCVTWWDLRRQRRYRGGAVFVGIKGSEWKMNFFISHPTLYNLMSFTVEGLRRKGLGGPPRRDHRVITLTSLKLI